MNIRIFTVYDKAIEGRTHEFNKRQRLYLCIYTKLPELKFFLNKAQWIRPASSLALQRNVTLRLPVLKINTSDMARYANKETLKI